MQGERRVVSYFTGSRDGYRIGVPRDGFYRALLNSDSAYFGGSNLGNGSGVPSEPEPWQGQRHSIVITVPPLAVVYLKPDRARQ